MAGDHYELGQQYGQILDDAGFTPEPLSTEKRRFVRDCEPSVEEHIPSLCEELRGLADAGDWGPRTDRSDAARAVLDTCRTVDDAVSFLERIPHARNTNFLVADAADDIASIEASPDAVATTRPTNGFGAVTNHFQSESMLEYEHIEERAESSETRLENLDDWFDVQRDGFDTADVQSVLTDPEDGVCSCANGNEDDPTLTSWSWALTRTVGRFRPKDILVFSRCSSVSYRRRGGRKVVICVQNGNRRSRFVQPS